MNAGTFCSHELKHMTYDTFAQLLIGISCEPNTWGNVLYQWALVAVNFQRALDAWENKLGNFDNFDNFITGYYWELECS